MVTEVVKIKDVSKAHMQLKHAGEIIKAGGLVAFPTETVYGLGGDALNKEASQKIYAAKGRPSDNPLIVHVADYDALHAIVKQIPKAAQQLAEKFWPGPMTLIFEKKDIVPMETTGGLSTVAVRMPSHEVAREFIREAGGYVAAPSANLSGRPSPTKASHVIEDMSGRIEMIIDGEDADIGLESTIIDVTGATPMILRPGYVTGTMVQEAVGTVAYDPAVFGTATEGLRPKAPGMKYRHYAPQGELAIVRGEREQVISYIRSACEKKSEGERVGIIATEETFSCYKADMVANIGARQDQDAIAKHLYGILRDFDEQKITKIYSEEFDSSGIGQAIMNRLIKAAGHQIIDLRKEG